MRKTAYLSTACSVSPPSHCSYGKPENRFVSTDRYTVFLGVLAAAFVKHMENLDITDNDGNVSLRNYVGGDRWSYRVYLAEKSNDIKDITDESFPISNL